MNSNLDALFGKSSTGEVSQSESAKRQKSVAEADKWIANQQSLFANVKRNLAKKPDSVSTEDVFAAMGLNHDGVYSFKLRDGAEIECDLLEFCGKTEIETKTVVHLANGRDQDALTKESLEDILSSIEAAGENFFPGVGGYCDDTGKITVFDGSRRRMAAIHTNSTFRLYVARGNISMRDAKYIADLSRLTKKLSHREEGKELLRIQKEHRFNTIEEIAAYVGQENEPVRQKINAARIPQKLIEVFPDYNGMTSKVYMKISSLLAAVKKEAIKECKSDYCSPNDVEKHNAYLKKVDETNNSFTGILIDEFRDKTKSFNVKDGSTKNQQEELVRILADIWKKPNKRSVSPEPIVNLSKNRYVTRASTGKGDRQKVKFTVSHMPEDKLKKLEDFMIELFQENS